MPFRAPYPWERTYRPWEDPSGNRVAALRESAAVEALAAPKRLAAAQLEAATLGLPGAVELPTAPSGRDIALDAVPPEVASRPAVPDIVAGDGQAQYQPLFDFPGNQPGVPEQPREESIEDVKARLGFSWGPGVQLDASGRPTTSTTIGAGTLSRPRVAARESTGGGGFVTADVESLPPGQRPPSYWEDRGLELRDIASRAALARGRTELAREQPSAAGSGLTIGEELATRTDPRRAEFASQQSILQGMSVLAGDLAEAERSGNPEAIKQAQRAYDTGQQLAKLYLTALAGRNLGFFGNDLAALLGGGGPPAAAGATP